ncbi:helicase RepA family protein [Marinicella litoralis]|uniref:AAA domain-containing protein n=1 Tax=Marinicella litoralis TaxID=644220 RepID=A0A4R6XT71_9GAMM|nr:helicase RepA family protein [Marinicella litoralis]TDR23145.1 AAA domain-containing protein [Marinicella litoralis]
MPDIRIDNNHSDSSNQSPLRKAGGVFRHKAKILTCKQFMSSSVEPNWLINGVIEKDTTGVLYGRTGTYKSFVALDWALSVATGKDWHSHETKQGVAVYVAGEGFHGLIKRVKAWFVRYGYDDAEFMPTDTRVAVLNDDEYENFLNQLEQIGQPIGLVIFDTLRKCFGRGDENSASEMGEFFSRVDAIRRAFNTTCLIIHHKNKSNVIRGSNSLESDVDYLYQLESKSKNKAVLHAEKLKDVETPSPKYLKFSLIDIGHSSEGETIQSLVPEMTKKNVDTNTNKPNGIRGQVYDYIILHCRQLTSWSAVIDGVSQNKPYSQEQITSALKGLRTSVRDGVIQTLAFDKIGGSNHVQSMSRGSIDSFHDLGGSSGYSSMEVPTVQTQA